MGGRAVGVDGQPDAHACHVQETPDTTAGADLGEAPIERLQATARVEQQAEAARVHELGALEVDPDLESAARQRCIDGLGEHRHGAEVDHSGHAEHGATAHDAAGHGRRER